MPNIIYWNPRKKYFKNKPFSYLPIYKRVNNFGDLIGPMLVDKILSESKKKVNCAKSDVNLLTVGSILHFASDGDVLWGTGRNGKILNKYDFNSLDIRAIRGPLTQDFLEKKSISCPSVFGDPGLLFPTYFHKYVSQSFHKKYDFTVVPNLNDLDYYKQDANVVSPTGKFDEIISRIVQSNFVVGSSLHAIIIAEAFGIPARLIKSQNEDDFKYEDYYLGSGRGGFNAARSVGSALEMGGEPSIDWDGKKLLESFPYDLWDK
ncbi:GumL protein [Marinobacterium zhoushanense]|uniref:GumL protein n=1 Tax=Marinobacterium zhoushanense TaxID=1679163 RepID=A0ABQ1KQM9_9GAMM|nr:polysaccharide pyruvyl transferase family protein [Marinobacterium zhoushanense]GGC06874.1 GumL protein [Marinobacterium zhoushanense]